jgi:galactokinase
MSMTVRAPGRVNLIGEHTDYNDGFVLPAAINLEISLAIRPSARPRVAITLAATNEQAWVELGSRRERAGNWLDYIAGVAYALEDAGLPIGGFTGRLTSSLPRQAGLSSSAALELAAAWALLVAAGGPPEGLDRMTLARLCQAAENGYVGVRCGIMDQFTSSCGVAGHALLLDCRSLVYRPVPIPAGIALVVVDTGSPRRLMESEYNARRTQCERGVAVLAARGEPVRALRDATLEMLDRAAPELGDETYRRCRHVVEENRRTLVAADALVNDDRNALGQLFAASHASLRELYEVSSPALDAAVEIATATPGVIAARMTGAGFGGCTINLVESSAVATLRRAMERDYLTRTGLRANIHEVIATDGAGPLPESVP